MDSYEFEEEEKTFETDDEGIWWTGVNFCTIGFFFWPKKGLRVMGNFFGQRFYFCY